MCESVKKANYLLIYGVFLFKLNTIIAYKNDNSEGNAKALPLTLPHSNLKNES